MVEPAGIPLLEGNPAVDRVIVLPKKQWLKQLRSVSGIPATVAGASSFVKELKSSEFDAVLDLQGLLKSALPAILSGSNLRFGFKGTREGADRLLTHALDVGDYFGQNRHVVHHNLSLADYAARVLLGEKASDITNDASHSYIYDEAHFPLPQASRESWKKVETLLNMTESSSGSSLIAFIPGTTWETKIWPIKKWIELAGLLMSHSPSRLLLIGGASEREMNRQISESFPERTINLTEKTEIPDLMALFSMTKLVVGADTGPLHLAAALGKSKIVAIFGSTPSGRNGPFGSQCSSISLNLDCQPCFEKSCPLKTLACLNELSAQSVFERIVPHI